MRLALHYWRPDFTPEQAKLLIEDYISDLRDLPLDLLDSAVASYRKDAANRFFPTSGQLRALITEQMRWRRADAADTSGRVPILPAPQRKMTEAEEERLRLAIEAAERGKIKSLAELGRNILAKAKDDGTTPLG